MRQQSVYGEMRKGKPQKQEKPPGVGGFYKCIGFLRVGGAKGI